MSTFCVILAGSRGVQIQILSGCVWEGPMKRVCESEDSVKQSPQQSGGRSSSLKKVHTEQKGGVHAFLPGWLSWDMCLLPPLALDLHCPLLWPSGSNWIYTLGFPGSPASRWQTVGLLRCRNSVSPYLLIKLSTYKRLVLFLCRTLTKHVQEVICENEKTLELVIVTFNDLKR